MGCHTWYKVPVIKGEEKILEMAQTNLNKWDYDDSTRKMYQYAIDNKLIMPVKDLAAQELSLFVGDNRWCLYEEVSDWSLKEYNDKNNKNVSRYSKEWDKLVKDNIIEAYSDEPRIAGYPNATIKSYDEMVKAMETGLMGTKYNSEIKDYEKQIFHFQYEENRKDEFMKGIKTFFELHPDGIIQFG